MGYNIYITRADSWAENDGYWITSEEWLRIVEQDEDLHLDPRNGPYFAIWRGSSEYHDPWFDWSKGNIFTKNPDPPLIHKMLDMATKLNAKVQGDDGEVYGNE